MKISYPYNKDDILVKIQSVLRFESSCAFCDAPSVCLNLRITSYQYRNPQEKDKMVSWPSYIYSVGEDGRGLDPYSRGFTPYPRLIFPPYAHPPFFHIFWGTTRPKFGFAPPPHPHPPPASTPPPPPPPPPPPTAHMTPAHFSSKAHPTPTP